MKNNRKNRKRVKMYFKAFNTKHNFQGNVAMKPEYLYYNKGRFFAILFGNDEIWR